MQLGLILCFSLLIYTFFSVFQVVIHLIFLSLVCIKKNKIKQQYSNVSLWFNLIVQWISLFHLNWFSFSFSSFFLSSTFSNEMVVFTKQKLSLCVLFSNCYVSFAYTFSIFFVVVVVFRFFYRCIGGNAGIPPGPLPEIAAPGPSKTCNKYQKWIFNQFCSKLFFFLLKKLLYKFCFDQHQNIIVIIVSSETDNVLKYTKQTTPTRCFCDNSNSAICALSVSNKTGANRIIELVKNIQDALHENLYSALVLLIEKSVAASQAVRTLSGNISVKPHRRSVNVSSGSCTCVFEKERKRFG